jgi:hypothetical protein
MAIRFAPIKFDAEDAADIKVAKKRLAEIKDDPTKLISGTDLAKRLRGRPPAPKPWIEAGVSRMTWYRRKKARRKQTLGVAQS